MGRAGVEALSTELAGSSGGPGPGALTLDQLIALNDEIAALVRAGVPLEPALLGLGGELGGSLGSIARAIGERMGRGEGLVGALASEGSRIPPVYRAVVEAGLRAGRLPAALEGIARYARRQAELRRVVGLAMLYPLMVLGLADALLIGFVTLVVPRFQEAFASLGLPSHASLRFLGWLGRTAMVWGPIGPLILIAIGLAWAYSGRAARLQPGWARRVLRRLPGVGPALGATAAAGFAELLALLIEHGVPLPEAIPLAAEATGDPALAASAASVAEAARRGESPRPSARADGLPPMLRWLMGAAGTRQGLLAPALRHAAETYRRRAADRADLIRVALPSLLLLAIGAGATLALTLTLIVPLSLLFRDLAAPP